MEKSIYGNLWLDGEAYPFFVQGRVVHIVQQAYEYIDELSHYKELPSIKGITSDNRQILFLNCKFIHRKVTVFRINGYIISAPDIEEECDFSFDSLSFYSEALNVFYSPQRAASTDLGSSGLSPSNWDGSMKIDVKPFSQTDLDFLFQDAKCKFSIARWRNQREGTPDIGSLETELIFNFQEAKGPDTVIQYFRYVYDFLSFVNYSRNISFEKILLSRNSDTHRVKYRAEILWNASAYEGTAFNTITASDLPDDKLAMIFEKIATLREQKGHNIRINLYYPESKEESRFVGPDKWLMAALCFEGLFDEVFSNYKTEKKDAFRIAKESILKAIDSNDIGGFTGKQKGYYKDCRDQVFRYEGILEEKFNHVLNTHRLALSEVLSSIELMDKVSPTENFGSIYQKYRNKLAHGTINNVECKELAVYKLLRPMIYILLLDGIALDEEELKRIIRKLFI